MVKDDDEPIPELGAVRLSSPSSMSSSKSTTAFGFPAKSTGSLFGSATKKTSTMGSLFGPKPTFTDAASPSSGDLFGIPRSKPTSATGFSFGSGPRPFGFGGGVFVGGSQAAPSVQGAFGGSAFHSFPEQAAAPVSSFGQLQQTELKPAPTMLFGSGPDSNTAEAGECLLGSSRPAAPPGSLFGQTQQTQENALVAEAVEKAEPMERQKQLHVLATPPPIPPRQQPKDKNSKGQPSAPVFSLKRRGAAAASPPPPPPPPPPPCSGGPPPLPPRPGSPFDPHRPRPTDKLHRNLFGVPSAKLKSAKVSPELRKPELYMLRSVREHPAKEEALDEMPNLGKKKNGAVLVHVSIVFP